MDGVARLIDVRTFRPFGEPMKSVGVVQGASFSADGRWLVTVSADHMAQVWDGSSGYAVADIARHSSELAGAALAGGGAFFVSAGHDRTVTVSRVGLDFPAPAPGWLPDLLEAAGGGRFDQVGTMSWIANREGQLRALGDRIQGGDAASWWGRWAAGSISRLAGANDEKQGERKQ
jgi:WD40 repeat protein